VDLLQGLSAATAAYKEGLKSNAFKYSRAKWRDLKESLQTATKRLLAHHQTTSAEYRDAGSAQDTAGVAGEPAPVVADLGAPALKPAVAAAAMPAPPDTSAAACREPAPGWLTPSL
jgi:hypothetical protein